MSKIFCSLKAYTVVHDTRFVDFVLLQYWVQCSSYTLNKLWLPSAGPISILPLWLTTYIISMNPGQLTLLGSTICVMLTMHFAVQLISEHLFCWKKPKEQKAIIIITLMAPIYPIDSFVGLIDFQGSKAFFMSWTQLRNVTGFGKIFDIRWKLK